MPDPDFAKDVQDVIDARREPFYPPLVLDSGVVIAAERDAKSVSELLTALEYEHGENEIVLSSITVMELEHGLHRAQTAEQERNRREYLDTVFAAIPVEPFNREMAQLAAKIDAEARRAGRTIPFSDPVA